MSFVKREYVDQQTVITAENMNAIQDELLRLGVSEGSLWNSVTSAGTKASNALDNEAAAYNYHLQYHVGDYCLYQQKLYRCTVETPAAGETWNSSHWTAVTVGDEMIETASELSELRNTLSNEYISKQEGITSDAQTQNLIVADAIIQGEYYDANGGVAKSGSFWRSPLFPVSPSTSYIAGSCTVSFFDSSKEFISRQAAWGGSTFTSPATAAFAGVSSNINYANTVYMFLASANPGRWVKGDKLITKDKIKDFDASAVSAVAGSDEFVPILTGKQLFDKDGVYSDITTGQYIEYNTGAPAIVGTLEWFPLDVSAGENYVCSGISDKLHAAFFSALPVGTTNYLDGLLASSGTYFTVPNGAKIMTISVKIANAGQLMVQKGTTATAYESYQRGIKSEYYLDKSVTLAKLNEDVINTFSTKNVVTVGSDECDYTNICTAIKENQSNTIFKLAAETFDIQADYEEEYGSDFFTNYTRYSLHPTDPMYRGLNLGIGCELYGQPNTELDFLYAGNNADVAQFFSVLSLTDNNVVNGVRIKINGHCRYAVHDDYSTIVGATNIIEHCVFFGTTSDGGRPYIGTGMGKASSYIYRDCIFDSTSTRAIGLHNCEQSALGRVEIYGCYCGATIYIFHYGVSTEKSPVMIHDCKASGIYLTWAAQETYPNENMELYAWNNITN